MKTKNRKISPNTIFVGITCLLIVVVVIVVGVNILSASRSRSETNVENPVNISSQEPATTNNSDASTTNSNISATQVERSLSGNSLAEDQMSSILVVQDVLNTILTKLDGREDIENVLEEVPENLASYNELLGQYIILEGLFEEPDVQIFLYQSLLSVAYSTRVMSVQDNISIIAGVVPGDIDVYQSLGLSFVPLSVFSGIPTFTIQTVYVDGAWMIMPHSFVSEVSLSISWSGLDRQ